MRINHRVLGAFGAAVALLVGSAGYSQVVADEHSQQPDNITKLAPVDYDAATSEKTPVENAGYIQATTCSALESSTVLQCAMQERVMLLDEGPLYGQSCGCNNSCVRCCPPPRWSWMSESVWFQRSGADRFPLSFAGSNDPAIMSTRDPDYGTGNGFRLTLAKALDCSSCTKVELSYLDIDGWNGRSQVVDPSRNIDSFLRLGIPNVQQFRNAFAHTVTADTSLNSFEINTRRYFSPTGGCTASALAGFRYIHIADNFQLLSNDSDPAISPDDIGLYTVRTRNDLVGGQIGGSVATRRSNNLSLGAKLKTGIFANFNEQNGRLLNVQPPSPPSTNLTSHASGTSISTMVETGLFADYNISRNCGLRAGYDVFIISGLALTANQLDFTANQFQAQSYINDTSSLVFHGPTAGLWMKW